MIDDLKDLIRKAKLVLAGNWLGRSTKPAPRLYPHQWNWDSGFVAIGYARYDQFRAQQELTTLFQGQWANGMLPQIAFNPEALGRYFPEPDFWQAERSQHYPRSVLTSGITMPPVHAIAARHVLEHATDGDEARTWLRELYPRILAQAEAKIGQAVGTGCDGPRLPYRPVDHATNRHADRTPTGSEIPSQSRR